MVFWQAAEEKRADAHARDIASLERASVDSDKLWSSCATSKIKTRGFWNRVF